jgi:hypothetical protein
VRTRRLRKSRAWFFQLQPQPPQLRAHHRRGRSVFGRVRFVGSC